MAQWNDYHHEDEDVDGEERDESGVDYTSTGRDSLVFLVDASKEMFIKGEDEEPSPFDMTMQCVRSVYTSKIISSDKDLVALVFYGTEQSKNPRNSFKHVYIYHDLDLPGARRVQDVDGLRGEKGAQVAGETMGSGNTNLGEALWCCSNLYSDIKLRLSHKRLMIFTCRDTPHGGDSERDRQARTKASDLKETGVVIDLMHLMKPGGFDVSLFFCDVVSPPEDEAELGLQMEPCGKLEDLQKRVRAKEMKKRSVARLNLCLGEGMNVAVGVYITALQARKPNAIKLYRDNNEPVRTKTRLYHTQTGSLLLPSDTKRVQVYAGRQIVMEKDEVDVIKKFSDPGLELIGFKPMERLKLHHHLRSAVFIYPEEEMVTGSACVFTALLRRCSERNVFALCKYTRIRNSPPRFLALVPQKEEVDDGQAQIVAPGFHGIFLPYADDIRTLDTPQLPTASESQVDKMKEIVHKLRFKYRSDAFENPVLQQHYRNLEALALDLMAPEHIEDLTMPNVNMMDQRLGSLAQEFRDLVYPADYNPEGKTAPKRKPAEAAGGTEKKPKVEMSEDELRGHVQKGNLGLWLDFNSVLTGALTVVGYLLYRFSQALPALIRWPIHLFCTLTGVSSLWVWVSHLMGTLRSLQYLLKWLSRIWRFIVASFTKLSGFTVIIQNNSGASSDSPPGTEPSPSPISIEPGLRLILTGPPGGGRTSLADALVGCSLPQVGGSLGAVMECTKRRVVVDRRELIIIDTPDLLGPSLGDSKRALETLRSLQLASPGPHAFLLVLQTPGSGDGVDQDVASATRALLELVGESATGHILIVLTHADYLGPGSTLAQLLEDDAGGLRTALYLCGQRAELVDNNPDKPVEERRELARGLLERLAEMRALRGHYTHELQKREDQVREELLMDMASVLARKLGQEY